MTTTIEDGFGSRLMTQGGFLLNNELTDFSFAPTDDGKPVANRVEAGKRPRSSMAPTIVLRPRGARVPWSRDRPAAARSSTTSPRRSIGVLDWGLDPQAAIALPNFGSRNGPTELEKDTSVVALEPKLRALGRDRCGSSDHTSGLQAIGARRSGWVGGADPRREGIVIGRVSARSRRRKAARRWPGRIAGTAERRIAAHGANCASGQRSAGFAN